MRLIYRCETCGKEIGASDTGGKVESESGTRDGLTGCAGEGIMDENVCQNVFKSLCFECREDIWGKDSSIMFFGNMFKH